MRPALMIRMGTLLAGVVSWMIVAGDMTSIARGQVQPEIPLASLSVPDQKLPSGCRLRPSVAPTRTVTRGGTTMIVASPNTLVPFPSNPWLGTDRKLLVDLRKRIDGDLTVPDGPPPTASELEAWEARWVRNVVDGYHAQYDFSDLGVEVSAIRFDDPALATSTQSIRALLHASPEANDRLTIGSTVVRVVGRGKSDCFKAVDDYIRALK